MLQNIREIGMFMVAAQAVAHFAPGKQYEKYIKTISSVIILLLFLRPFLQMAGGSLQASVAFLETLEEIREPPALAWQKAGKSQESALITQMEEEIRSRLNLALAQEPMVVTEVALFPLEEEGELSFSAQIRVQDISQKEQETDLKDKQIWVGKIRLEGSGEEEDGKQKDGGQREVLRQRFSRILEWEEARVEVIWDG